MVIQSARRGARETVAGSVFERPESRPMISNSPPMTRLGLLVLALGAALSTVACEEKKNSTETAAPDANASTDKYATADPKLAKVLQASPAAGAPDKGPPPEGIFAPGVADQRHPKGAPTNVDFLADGSEPHVSLLPAGDAARTTSYGPAALEIAMGPRSAVPPIDFGLTLGPAKKEDGGSDWLVADVRKALPSRKQSGDLPPGMDKDIGALAGSSVRLNITPDGRESEMQTQLGKTTRVELERLATSAAEALLFATVPLPAKPVGVGAQWIAETRMPLSGVDVVVYRAYRVKDIDGDRLHLTLDVKGYATGKDVQLQGVPKGATLDQFDAQLGGELELVRGEWLARKSQVQERVVMVFQAPSTGQAPPTSPGQPPAGMMTAQVQIQTSFVRGDDLRVTAKQP
jgi:hypothetical protein